jgi:hypothetical protein
MELLEVLAQHLGRVASRVAGDEDGQKHFIVLGLLFDLVDDLGHLVQLVGADIRAMRETEVDLEEEKNA